MELQYKIIFRVYAYLAYAKVTCCFSLQISPVKIAVIYFYDIYFSYLGLHIPDTTTENVILLN
jgi:hypothetical protein